MWNSNEKSPMEKILLATNGGKDIFRRYLGDKVDSPKTFTNPYRNDQRPSCRIYWQHRPSGDRHVLYDFGDPPWPGDAFHFMAMMGKMDAEAEFSKVLHAIDNELGLGIFDGNKEKFEKKVEAVKNASRNNYNVTITAFSRQERPFYPTDRDFWGQYGIDAATLDRFHVVPLAKCRFYRNNNTSFQLWGARDNPMYGYIFERGMKVYRPRDKTRFLYAGDIPKPYVFGWNQLPKTGDKVFITGGEKDVMSLSAHGFNALTFNSETAELPEDKVSELSRRFGDVFIMFDSDETGRRESTARYEELRGKVDNLHHLVLPLSGVKSDKDISDFFRDGHSAKELDSIAGEVLARDGGRHEIREKSSEETPHGGLSL